MKKIIPTLLTLLLSSCANASGLTFNRESINSSTNSGQIILNNFFSTANGLIVIPNPTSSTIEVFYNYSEEPVELNTFNFEKYNYYADIMYINANPTTEVDYDQIWPDRWFSMEYDFFDEFENTREINFYFKNKKELVYIRDTNKEYLLEYNDENNVIFEAVNGLFSDYVHWVR